MRKYYQKPSIMTLAISEQRVIMSSNFTETETDTIPYYTDDPQDPGNALSRQHGRSVWDEEENDEEEEW